MAHHLQSGGGGANAASRDDRASRTSLSAYLKDQERTGEAVSAPSSARCQDEPPAIQSKPGTETREGRDCPAHVSPALAHLREEIVCKPGETRDGRDCPAHVSPALAHLREEIVYGADPLKSPTSISRRFLNFPSPPTIKFENSLLTYSQESGSRPIDAQVVIPSSPRGPVRNRHIVSGGTSVPYSGLCRESDHTDRDPILVGCCKR